MKQYAVKEYLTGEDIRQCRKKLEVTQEEFAALVRVSKKTVERWEYADQPIKGPIVPLVALLMRHPEEEENMIIPEKKFPVRISYMFRDELCTIIDVDESSRQIHILNYADYFMKRAFGNNENPTYEDYEEFLESRCFPRQRDKMKLALKELDLPFYDPALIVEKTEGRMAEDDFWIKIER